MRVRVVCGEPIGVKEIHQMRSAIVLGSLRPTLWLHSAGRLNFSSTMLTGQEAYDFKKT
jgi:hypothetical protein